MNTTPPSSWDPFALTANPAAYVAREATERAVGALEDGLAAGRGMLVLEGPSGIGKTTLLRVLGERMRERWRAVFLPYPALPSPALCRWALQTLGDASPDDPETALLAQAGREARDGGRLVLLLDDVQSLPPDTADRLGELVERAGGGLALVAAALQAEDPSPGTQALLARGAVRVVLDEAMSAEETAEFVRARLARAGAAPEIRRLFDEARLAAIARESQGVPVRVQELATAVVRGRAERVREESDRPAETAPPPPPEPLADAPSEGPGVPPEVEPPAPPEVPLSPAPAPDPAMEPAEVTVLAPEADRAPDGRGDRWVIVAGLVLLLGVAWGAVRAWTPETRSGAGGEPPAAAVPPVLVNVNAAPWATIWIDGEEIGLTPLGRIPVAPGAHRFRARLPDGTTLERTLRIDEEERHVTFP